MKWEPIAKYDKLKTKPKRCVFIAEAEKDLPETITVDRRFGFRNITHFLRLPKRPE